MDNRTARASARSDDRRSAGNSQFTNKDKVTVIGQIGNVVHSDVRIYADGSSKTPEELFQTALNSLDGNMPRRAEELIQKAVEDGLKSNRVAYYWILSILSGRSFDQLDNEKFDAIQRAFGLVDDESADDWQAGLVVIWQFINCLIQHHRRTAEDRKGEAEDAEFEQAIADHERLPPQQREEIRRHLDLIMTGALQDRVDARYAREIEQKRYVNDRKGRAWKFFEAKPAAPRKEIFPEPRFGPAGRAFTVLGLVLMAIGLLIMVVLSVRWAPLLALVVVAGIAAGGYLLATNGRDWLVAREQVAADGVRNGERQDPYRRYLLEPHPRQVADDDDFDWEGKDAVVAARRREISRRERFESSVNQWVNVCFAVEEPDGARLRREWWADTAGLRRGLAADLKRRYAGVPVNQLDWLITWHAKRARERWGSRMPRGEREKLNAPVSTSALALLGLVGVAAGVISGLIGAFNGSPRAGIAAIVALAAGAAIAYASKADAYAVRRDLHAAESRLAKRRYDAEKLEFDRWSRVLADRPSDADVARWLDYDKLYIKNRAMKEIGISNRDIEAYAIVTEPRYPCQKARVLFGPPRYSHYWVTVILLTAGGVDKVAMDLAFLDGEVNTTQDRDGFPYNAISRGRLLKLQSRFDGDRRDLLSPDEQADEKESRKNGRGNGRAGLFGNPSADPWSRGTPASARQPSWQPHADKPEDDRPTKQYDDSLTFVQAQRIFLNSGEYVDFVVQNIDEDFLDRVEENANTLYELALDASGMKSAQQLLATVASNGPGWLAVKREIRKNRLDDFRRSAQSRRQALTARAAPGPARVLPRARRVDGVVHVPVAGGGKIAVEQVSGATAPVLAVHGLTSQRRQLDWLRGTRPDLSLIMPDLRGRGDSARVSGPSSIAQHAEDMLAIVDYLHLDAVHVCGLSMGAVAAVEMAALYPDRVKSLVLVDGGFPTSASSMLTPEAPPAFVRDLMVSQRVQWGSVQDYVYSFIAERAPMLSTGDALLLSCLEHDLDEFLARKLDGQMLYADTASAQRGSSSWRKVSAPTWLLAAQWGTGEGTVPAYPPEALTYLQDELSGLLSATVLPGADHAVAVMSMEGARHTASLIGRALETPADKLPGVRPS
jgi:pimeloyl-ACP methyl ester carboxylesterase